MRKRQGPAVPVGREDPDVNLEVPGGVRLPRSVGVSLSGGGYRATLFGVGALAAIHDADLWPLIRWISSVSGGSFASAAAATMVPPGGSRAQLNRFVRRAADSTAKRFSLARGRPLGASPGRQLEGFTARRIERGIVSNWAGEDGRAPRLSDVGHPDRSHVFMAIDLSTQTPVFLSDQMVITTGLDEDEYGTYRPGDLTLARAVQASSAFPGLPAVRVTREELGEVASGPVRVLDLTDPASVPDLYLADGGLWNNLATSWPRDVKVLRRRFDDLDFGPAGDVVDVQVVVDASAPVWRSDKLGRLQAPRRWEMPGGSLGRSFLAASQSTLEARREQAQSDGVVRVDLTDLPHFVQPRCESVWGDSKEEWLEIRSHVAEVDTARSTAFGLSRDRVVDLLAHGYACTAAHLTDQGLADFESFVTSPHQRVEAALST